MTSLLITRPEHDKTTHYLSHWAKENIFLAEQRGFNIFDLFNEKANRKEVEGRLQKTNPRLVLLNGHGNEFCVTGNNFEPLIVCGENEQLLKSKIVYALSCKSGKVLGLKSVEAGAVSYAGYDDDFIFTFEQNLLSRPLDDKTAGLFLSPSNLFVQSLIKGNSVGDSALKIQSLLRKNFIQSMADASKDRDLSRFLWWDLTHFVVHGDKTATL